MASCCAGEYEDRLHRRSHDFCWAPVGMNHEQEAKALGEWANSLLTDEQRDSLEVIHSDTGDFLVARAPGLIRGAPLRCPRHGLKHGDKPFNTVDDPSGKCFSCGSELEAV